MHNSLLQHVFYLCTSSFSSTTRYYRLASPPERLTLVPFTVQLYRIYQSNVLYTYHHIHVWIRIPYLFSLLFYPFPLPFQHTAMEPARRPDPESWHRRHLHLQRGHRQ